MNYDESAYTTCDICGAVWKETRKKFYCDHCARYYFVCPNCQERGPHCVLCGIPLKKKTEPSVANR